MNTICLWAASAASVGGFYIHTFIGGRRVARPLLKNKSLTMASKWISYFCWHAATILLVCITVAYTFAATTGRGVELVAGMGLMSALLCGLGIWVSLRAGFHVLRLPPTNLFALLAVLSAAAVTTG